MRFDPFDAAAHVTSVAQFEGPALEFLGRAVGYDVAFMGLRGASMSSVGLARDTGPIHRFSAPIPNEPSSADGIDGDGALTAGAGASSTSGAS
jgi:hypothetical protein